jgi:hypothetical protein
LPCGDNVSHERWGLGPLDVELERAAVAMVLAVVDGACDERVHDLACVGGKHCDELRYGDHERHFGMRLAHHLAHRLAWAYLDDDAESRPDWEREEMRERLRADLLDDLHFLAGQA